VVTQDEIRTVPSDLARFLSGKKLGFLESIDYYNDLAIENGMPVLDIEDKSFIENFNVNYINSNTIEDLTKMMELGSPFDKSDKNYSHFQHELHKKVVADPDLIFALLQKFTGALNHEDVAEQKMYRFVFKNKDVINFLLGKDASAKDRKVFVDKIYRYNFELTKQQKDYINHFTIKYIENTSLEKLKKEMPNSGYSFDFSIKTYSFFKIKLSEKIRSDRELQYALFKKFSGAEALEDLTSKESEGSRGYSNIAGIASMALQESISDTYAGKYFKGLAREFNMPILNKKSQDFIDNLSVENLKSMDQEYFDSFFDKKNTIDKNSRLFSHFYLELSKKMRTDKDLQKAFFIKATGVTSPEEIVQTPKGDIPSCNTYMRMTGILSGELLTQKEVYHYLRDLLK